MDTYQITSWGKKNMNSLDLKTCQLFQLNRTVIIRKNVTRGPKVDTFDGLDCTPTYIQIWSNLLHNYDLQDKYISLDGNNHSSNPHLIYKWNLAKKEVCNWYYYLVNFKRIRRIFNLPMHSHLMQKCLCMVDPQQSPPS